LTFGERNHKKSRQPNFEVAKGSTIFSSLRGSPSPEGEMSFKKRLEERGADKDGELRGGGGEFTLQSERTKQEKKVKARKGTAFRTYGCKAGESIKDLPLYKTWEVLGKTGKRKNLFLKKF